MSSSKLYDIVRGDWCDKYRDDVACYVCTGAPEWLKLAYGISDDTSNADVDRKKANVRISTLEYRLNFWAYGDTARKSLECLIEKRRDDIERYAGTIHPEEIDSNE